MIDTCICKYSEVVGFGSLVVIEVRSNKDSPAGDSFGWRTK